MIEAFAPAKINFTLLVGEPLKTGKHKGYHPLNSLVVFAKDIGDKISIERSDGFEFFISGPFSKVLANDDSNLVVKAAKLMARVFEKPLNIAIALEKNLPVAAGIGGGSADAAATIIALNRFWGLGLSKSQLCEFGVQLGADIPVCIMGESVIMESIGDVFSSAPILPPKIAILIANPLKDCPTGLVFKTFDSLGNFASIEDIKYSDFRDLDRLVANLEIMPNSLYSAAIEIVPQIIELKTAIEASDGAKFVAMSGSGASVFGIFDNFENAEKAASYLYKKFEKNQIWAKAGTIK